MRIAIAAMIVLSAVTARAEPVPATEPETAAATVVVVAWLDAQNMRDLTAYRALYAPRFTGVKRVGAVTSTLDRAAWLADRSRMFRARTPMKVEATNIDVTTDGANLIVELDQRWEQGAFADVGHKRIVLDRDAALATPFDRVIVAEEMVSSRVLLTEAACLHAVYPDAKGGRTSAEPDAADVVGIAVIDLGGDRFACMVTSRFPGGDMLFWTIAALRSGKRWTELSRLEDFVNDEPGAPLHYGDTGNRGSITATPVALAPTEVGVLVLVTQERSDGPEYQRTQRASLHRLTSAGFTELLQFASNESQGADDGVHGSTCELRVLARYHGGLTDLDVVCTVNEGVGNPIEDDFPDRVTHTVEHYLWNGTDYVEK